jgi:hypothetical protein
MGNRLTTCHCKKLIVRKPKMWPRNSQIEWNRPRQWKRINELRSVKLTTGKKGQKTELTGKRPLRRRRSALDCSATEEEEWLLLRGAQIVLHSVDKYLA